MIYHVLDIFFIIFHSSLIIVNIFGWIWKKTRILNLITLLVTGASWSLLGWIVGVPGYCPLTDWHFRILEKLGEIDLPVSYIKYLIDRIFGTDVDPILVDRMTLWLFITVLLLSLFLNACDHIKKHRELIIL
jgi:hypothetical protein